MASSYKVFGALRRDMCNYKEALEYYNKALEIDKEIDDRVGVAKDYSGIGSVLDDMGDYKEFALTIENQFNFSAPKKPFVGNLLRRASSSEVSIG